jgi:hypothetical protein
MNFDPTDILSLIPGIGFVLFVYGKKLQGGRAIAGLLLMGCPIEDHGHVVGRRRHGDLCGAVGGVANGLLRLLRRLDRNAPPDLRR